ncbi:MAG TPA: hypothetical protein VIJ09_03425 [Acidimicrobiales bacterium]
MTEGVSDPAQEPAVLLGHRIDLDGAGSEGPSHHGFGIIDN